MAINYPLTLPSAPKKISINAVSNVGISQSTWTYKQHVFVNQGQMWTAKVVLPPLTEAVARRWAGFFTALNGRQGTFLLGDESYKRPMGTSLGTPLASGTIRSSEITISGLDADQSGAFLQGDYFSLNNTLYMFTQDVSSDGSGNATACIYPYLRATVTNELMQTVSPKGIFRLTENDVTLYQVSHENIYTVAFDALESV